MIAFLLRGLVGARARSCIPGRAGYPYRVCGRQNLRMRQSRYRALAVAACRQPLSFVLIASGIALDRCQRAAEKLNGL
jgi:hypothetical protein